MKIDIKKIPIIILTTKNNSVRHNDLSKTFDGWYNIHYYYNDTPSNWIKQIPCSAGHIRCIKKGLELGAPFLVLEDDVFMTDNFDNIIDVPDNSDMIYLGVSNKGVDFKNNIDCWDADTLSYISIENYNHLVKLNNMLSAHAIIYVNSVAAYNCGLILLESIMNNGFSDCWIANSLSLMNVYCYRKPLFYQGGSTNKQLMIETTSIILDKDKTDIDYSANRSTLSNKLLFS